MGPWGSPPRMREASQFMLVGGPYGPFFSELAAALERTGAGIFRVHLNGAESLYWKGRAATRFTDPAAAWPSWVARELERRGISDLIVYGDCQFYTRQALLAAEKLGIRRHVFEAGYFRPDWITLEHNGVNGYSSLPHDPKFFREEAARLANLPYPDERIAHPLRFQTRYAIADGLTQWFTHPLYRNYRSSQKHGLLRHAISYIRRYSAQTLRRRQQERN